MIEKNNSKEALADNAIKAIVIKYQNQILNDIISQQK